MSQTFLSSISICSYNLLLVCSLKRLFFQFFYVIYFKYPIHIIKQAALTPWFIQEKIVKILIYHLLKVKKLEFELGRDEKKRN